MTTDALVYIKLAALAANELAAELENSGETFPEGFTGLFRCTDVCEEKEIQFPVEFKDTVAGLLRIVAARYAVEEGAERIVESAEEAADFLEYTKTCPHCNGTGRDERDERRPCRECGGDGVI